MARPLLQPAVARRREVAEATWRVIAARGLDHASLRAIAHELGTSIGVLTHHFPDKDDLLVYTFEELVGELFGEALGNAESVRGLPRVEQILLGALPLDRARATRWRVWASFLGSILANPALLQVERRGTDAFAQAIAGELATLQARGEIRSGIEPSSAARELTALLDGLAIDHLLDPASLTTADLVRIICDRIESLAPDQ